MNLRQKVIKKYMMLSHQGSFDFLYSEENSRIIPHYYYGDRINVRIPKKYLGISIESIASGCFGSNQSIESVSIAEGISAIY